MTQSMTCWRHWLKRGPVLFGLLLGVGCSAPVTTPVQPMAEPASVAQDVVQPLPAGVTVELVDHAELLSRLADQRGRVVVLDCWSTSCPPCVKEFPGLVALQAEFGDQVACLSLSLDYEGFGSPAERLPAVKGFLDEIGAAAIENLLAREDADTMYAKLELDSVPMVSVWDREGRLIKRFDDNMASEELGRPFTYADVRQVVERLLAGALAPVAPKESEQ